MIQIFLKLFNYVVVNMMITLSIFTLFFVIIGDFEFSGFFREVGRLAARYQEADLARQYQFHDLVRTVASTLFLTICLVRIEILGVSFKIIRALPTDLKNKLVNSRNAKLKQSIGDLGHAQG